MAFPTAFTVQEALGKIQATARRAKGAVQQLNNQSAAGNTPVRAYVDMINSVHTWITAWDSVSGTAGLAQYARDQYDNQGLDIVAEFTNMRAAAIGLRDWIFTNVPKDGDNIPLLQTLSADGTLSDRTLTPAQTTGFRTEAQAFLNTVN